jgi:ferredoxin
MRIKVDMDKCIGAGHCVKAAPAVFGQNDDDGMVIVKTSTPAADQTDNVRKAIRLCPARVIEELSDPTA